MSWPYFAEAETAAAGSDALIQAEDAVGLSAAANRSDVLTQSEGAATVNGSAALNVVDSATQSEGTTTRSENASKAVIDSLAEDGTSALTIIPASGSFDKAGVDDLFHAESAINAAYYSVPASVVPSAPLWQFILTDLNGGVIGELRNAAERKIVLPHQRIPTCAFRIPLWHPYADTLMNDDNMVKAYRTDPITGIRRLVFHGPVVNAEETGEQQQTIQVSAAGPYWRLMRRFIGKNKAGVAFATQDLGLTAHSVLDIANGEDYTGIAKGTRVNSINGTYGPVWVKNAAEAIAELSAGLNSFEIGFTTTEAVQVGGVGGWPKIAEMHLAPIIGITRPDAIFEYGTTRANVASYTRKSDREGRANRAIISVAGWPDAPELGHDLIVRQDNASIAAAGLHEAVVSDGGVIDDALRTSIADFHITLRKNPRQQITFKPARNARPAPLVDYNVGDTVRARAVVRGNTRFDALFRIWGITFDVDQNGNENAELELVMP
jgi:hypothetical protein